MWIPSATTRRPDQARKCITGSDQSMAIRPPGSTWVPTHPANALRSVRSWKAFQYRFALHDILTFTGIASIKATNPIAATRPGNPVDRPVFQLRHAKPITNGTSGMK